MKISKIVLENYRNIENLTAEFDDVNIIWGENAQGKTNLTEAIYLFTGAHSFRGNKDKELIMFGKNRSRLYLEFYGNNREQNAEIEIEKRKKVKLNGIAKKSATALGDEIKTVIFSPVHLSMVKDGPSERRKFVDSALCQLKSNYRNLLKNYNKALEQRNYILKNSESLHQTEATLEIWDMSLAKSGAKIIYQRMKYIEALAPYLKDIFKGLSGGSEEIELKYIGATEFTNDINDIENKLYDTLRTHIKTDIINHTTTKGPHRDDIEILINSKSVKLYGSQGQQRSCVLAMKLAEASLLKEKTEIEPVALLDDVMSELDEKRQDYILNHIKNLQVFITCCDKETILRLKKGKTFHIENGKIVP